MSTSLSVISTTYLSSILICLLYLSSLFACLPIYLSSLFIISTYLSIISIISIYHLCLPVSLPISLSMTSLYPSIICLSIHPSLTNLHPVGLISLVNSDCYSFPVALSGADPPAGVWLSLHWSGGVLNLPHPHPREEACKVQNRQEIKAQPSSGEILRDMDGPSVHPSLVVKQVTKGKKASSRPRDRTGVSCIGRQDALPSEPPGKPRMLTQFMWNLDKW